MMLIGSEFKRIRVRNIVNFPAKLQKFPQMAMFIGNGVFHITGKITLTDINQKFSRVRFITEKQTESQVPRNASFLLNPRRGRLPEWDVDFTISLDSVNGRSLFFQGEAGVGRLRTAAPCVFNGIIDQVG